MNKVINLLWTGGWDSTFRLLQILLIEKRIVQPIYIIDTSRKSLAQELIAIEKIILLLKKNYPNESENLKEVSFYYKNLSTLNDLDKQYFNAFKKVCHIGEQYLWLSGISTKYNLEELELSIEKFLPDMREGTWFHEVIKWIIGEGHECQIDIQNLKDEKVLLFKYYRFPIIHLAKNDMAGIAREHGFYDILTQSWFCHNPILNRPCGYCRPCKVARHNNNYTFT